jgi:hypothetical protein
LLRAHKGVSCAPELGGGEARAVEGGFSDLLFKRIFSFDNRLIKSF